MRSNDGAEGVFRGVCARTMGSGPDIKQPVIWSGDAAFQEAVTDLTPCVHASHDGDASAAVGRGYERDCTAAGHESPSTTSTSSMHFYYVQIDGMRRCHWRGGYTPAATADYT